MQTCPTCNTPLDDVFEALLDECTFGVASFEIECPVCEEPMDISILVEGWVESAR
jgi:hypothetical protein